MVVATGIRSRITYPYPNFLVASSQLVRCSAFWPALAMRAEQGNAEQLGTEGKSRRRSCRAHRSRGADVLGHECGQ
jgi:hypothetical protein